MGGARRSSGSGRLRFAEPGTVTPPWHVRASHMLAEAGQRVLLAAQARRRGLAWAAIVLLLSGLLAADAYLLLQDAHIARRLEAAARRRLGCEVVLEGLELSLGGTGSVAAASLVLAPPRSGARPTVLRAARVRFTHAPLALLRGSLRLEAVRVAEVQITVDAPLVLLEAVQVLWRALGAETSGEDGFSLEVARLVFAPAAEDGLGGQGPVAEPAPASGRGAAGQLPAAVVLEGVEVRPAGRGAAALRFRARYRAAAMETLGLEGTIDFETQTARLDVRASNLPVHSPALAALAPALAPLIAALGAHGPVDLDLDVDYPWQAPAAAEVAGTIECYALALEPPLLAAAVTNVAGQLRLEGRRLAVTGLRGVYGGGVIRVRGELGDLVTGSGVRLDVTATRLQLEALAGLKLGPWARALGALQLGGQGGGRLSLASEPGVPLARAQFDGELLLEQAQVLGGALGNVHGAVRFAGRLGAGEPLRGALVLDRAQLADDVPLRGLGAELAFGPAGLVLERGSGRLAGGTIRFAAEVRPAAAKPAVRVELEAEGVDALPVLRALGIETRLEAMRLRGELRYRGGGSQEPGLAVEVRFGGLELGELPPLRPLVELLQEAGVAATRFERGTAQLALGAFDPEPLGGYALRLSLFSEPYDLGLAARLRPGGRLEGTATALRRDAGRAERYHIAGTLAHPLFTSPFEP
ncbi:MAG: hypothetical protein KatS3mg102_1739 [Planctomycetota bacterium]|nr:MAG: hypothetical protein KatS3mg102_1739 [Planctomycetota bacterium]